VICAECGRPLDHRDLKNAAYEIVGWEQPRDRGGTNHVLWRKRTGRVMCAHCVLERKTVVHPHQQSLL
jgi:hypothetical protein